MKRAVFLLVCALTGCTSWIPWETREQAENERRLAFETARAEFYQALAQAKTDSQADIRDLRIKAERVDGVMRAQGLQDADLRQAIDDVQGRLARSERFDSDVQRAAQEAEAKLKGQRP